MNNETKKPNGNVPQTVEAPETQLSKVPVADQTDIDVQIATAHRYPRSISTFKRMAMEMATADEETAKSCFYALPRAGKNIEGPGVRLAEIVGSAWGNMRYGARIVGERGNFIIAEGVAHDLERNVAMTTQVHRRITDKYSRRYSDDMIAVTANAACSIALRNAIFKVVPKTYVDSIYEKAKEVAVGDTATLASRRHKMLEHFQKMGIQPDRIYRSLDVKGIEDITLEMLEKLIGWSTALRDGVSTLDEIFPPVVPVAEETGSRSRVERVTRRVTQYSEQEPSEMEPA